MLILASTSRYRRELLQRLHLPFVAESPGVGETRQPGEAVRDMALRLACEKAEAVASRAPTACVIGSDQAAEGPDGVLGKTADARAQAQQLASLSGQTVNFWTALAVIDGVSGQRVLHVDRTICRFRMLGQAEIDRYVSLEPAWDCAGGFKCEGLGISLFESIETMDPTALIGLPMIATARALRALGRWPAAPVLSAS